MFNYHIPNFPKCPKFQTYVKQRPKKGSSQIFYHSIRFLTLLSGMCIVILCHGRMKNGNRPTACWASRHYTHSYICMRTVSQDPHRAHPLSLIGHRPISVGAGVVQLADSSVVMTGLLSLSFWDHCVSLPLRHISTKLNRFAGSGKMEVSGRLIIQSSDLRN